MHHGTCTCTDNHFRPPLDLVNSTSHCRRITKRPDTVVCIFGRERERGRDFENWNSVSGVDVQQIAIYLARSVSS